MMNKKKILITGAAGFIGANFINTIATTKEILAEYTFDVLDALTYASNFANIKEFIEKYNFGFFKIDIRNIDQLRTLLTTNLYDGIIHYAAESHVDRSIQNPGIFLETNTVGTYNLLECALNLFSKNKNFRYLQVSTDEVYGDLQKDEPAFTEQSHIKPSSPYSASKAAADLLVQAYHRTYGLPTIIARCSNNYGPFQYSEKFIPVIIQSALQHKNIPIYGNGNNIRNWIYVDDSNNGIWLTYVQGIAGEIYNFGGDIEITNIELAKKILNILGHSENALSFVEDRPGHDFRYAMDYTKAKTQLKWRPKTPFEEGLQKTISWFRRNAASPY